jgi:hypothetical protein
MATDDTAWSALDAAHVERIVRALAEQPAPIDQDYWQCCLCGKEPTGGLDNVAAHDTDCAWRMAREWVAEQHTGPGPDPATVAEFGYDPFRSAT